MKVCGYCGLNGSYLEIKGYMSSKSKSKIKQFPYEIKVWRSEEMKPILDYVKNKHGNKFWEKLFN